MKKFLFSFLPALLLMGCNNPKPATSQSETGTEPTWSLTELWSTDTVMLTCESVLYDEQRQQLYVACINGAPTEKNGKGYIAMLDPDGNIKILEWVTGLNAPKGMGVYGNSLYVTDIDRVVLIDIEKGEVTESIPVEGATFLNDIALDTDGTVYFTDSNSGWIWTLKDGLTSAWIEGDFNRPNGLLIEKERVLLTSSGSSDMKVIDKATGTCETVTTNIGYGDGVEFTGKEGHYIVSDWSGEIFLVLPDYSRISLLRTLGQKINSADIGFNIKKQVVYVPTFFDNRVVAYRLEFSGS
ncbi:MAG: hypothetical protein GY790_12800 [Bacteroidetes bacterium]|nr:hypothetical protein [Bacteroidota bacterium]